MARGQHGSLALREPPHVVNPEGTFGKASPRLGCAAIVMDKDRILLGIRNKEPYRGRWVIPGGGVRFLEGYRSTAKREIREEVGIDIEVDRIFDIREVLNPPDEHRVIIYCVARYVGGEIRPSSDIAEAKFLSRHEVQELLARGAMTPTVADVLRDLRWL